MSEVPGGENMEKDGWQPVATFNLNCAPILETRSTRTGANFNSPPTTHKTPLRLTDKSFSLDISYVHTLLAFLGW